MFSMRLLYSRQKTFSRLFWIYTKHEFCSKNRFPGFPGSAWNIDFGSTSDFPDFLNQILPETLILHVFVTTGDFPAFWIYPKLWFWWIGRFPGFPESTRTTDFAWRSDFPDFLNLPEAFLLLQEAIFRISLKQWFCFRGRFPGFLHFISDIDFAVPRDFPDFLNLPEALAISQIPRFYVFLLMLMSGLRYSFMIGSAQKVVYILCVQGASAPPPRSGLIYPLRTD